MSHFSEAHRSQTHEIRYHGSTLEVDISDLSWIIQGLETAQAIARHERAPEWQHCAHCDHMVYTNQAPVICQLCTYIAAKDHHALDCVADLMKIRYEPHVAAVEIARVRTNHPQENVK